MRILFTYMGGSGHYGPLTPVARAALDRGQEVAFVAHPSTARQIAGGGFRTFKTPDRRMAPERIAVHEQAEAIETIAEREDFLLCESFARLHAGWQVEDVLQVCEQWRPDVIMRDEADFGSAVAAELLGLPVATVLVIAAGSLIRQAVIAEPLHALRARYRLALDPDLEMLQRGLVLSPFPPRFRDPDFPLPATAVSLRPFGIDPTPGETLPDWVSELPDRPTVYFSLGTEFNTERQDIFAPVITGLREMPVNLIVTVGRDVDPAIFGEQPANVHIERFISQSLLLPHCALVVTHGGSGTVMGTLAHGLPMVVIPLGADQPQNAARCAALGVGKVVIDTDLAPETVRAAAVAVLGDIEFRIQAARLRDEIAGLPGPEQAALLLEQLLDKDMRSS